MKVERSTIRKNFIFIECESYVKKTLSFLFSITIATLRKKWLKNILAKRNNRSFERGFQSNQLTQKSLNHWEYVLYSVVKMPNNWLHLSLWSMWTHSIFFYISHIARAKHRAPSTSTKIMFESNNEKFIKWKCIWQFQIALHTNKYSSLKERTRIYFYNVIMSNESYSMWSSTHFDIFDTLKFNMVSITIQRITLLYTKNDGVFSKNFLLLRRILCSA